MAKKQKSGDFGKLGEGKFPLSEFEKFMVGKLNELEVKKREVEDKYGCGRINTFVDVGFSVKFQQQHERVWLACQGSDIEKLDRAVGGMIKAYQALEDFAKSHGIKEQPKIANVQKVLKDGSTMVIVQTQQDAQHYRQFWLSDKCHVWSMEDIEKLLDSEIVQDIVKMKTIYAQFGAQVLSIEKVPTQKLGSGFDDMEDDLQILEGEPPPKMFIAPKEKRNAP